jgi:hypothetical protein
MVRSKLIGVAILWGSLNVSLPCWSQATDQISGTIVDSTGASVVGGQVKAMKTDTGFNRTTTTNGSGFYQLVSLPIGPYEITVSAPGFKSTVQRVVLQVSVNPTVNISLQVGSIEQQVVVEAAATMAETQNASVGQVINSQSVINLPLNGRNATQLVLLSGGAAQIGGFTSSKNYPSSVTIAVAGGDTNGTTYKMDGGYFNDVFSSVNLPMPFPDVLQEFSVQTSSIPASFGERAGGVVNAVTKSGTNQFHGSLFEFVRNGAVNAKNYFATSVDMQKRNQFGATFGGPIKHDNLFFFGGWQETVLRQAPPTSKSYTPTAAQLKGDFSGLCKTGFNAGLCTTSSQQLHDSTGMKFLNNQIPVASFSPASLNTMKYVPVGAPADGLVQYSIPNKSNENQFLARVDWDQSQRNRVFGRYYLTKISNPAPSAGKANLLLTTMAGIVDSVQALTVGDNFTISQKAINTLHYTWSKENVDRGGAPGLPTAQDLGLNVALSPKNSPQLTVSSYFSTMCGTCSVAQVYSGATQVADDVNYINGRHQISFGGEWIRKYLHYVTSSQQNAAITFNGTVSGNAIADFLIGAPSTFQEGNITIWDPISYYHALYFSDLVRLSKNLNITAGVRWEPFYPQHDTMNRASHFDPGALAAGQVSSVFTNAPAGFTYPLDKGFPVGGTARTLTRVDPRLGVVWDVRGDAKTVVRAGFGILENSRTDLEAFDRFGFQPPWASLVTLNNPAGGWDNPFQAYPGGNPFPMPVPPKSDATFVTSGTYVNMPIRIKPTYYEEWNLSVQQQLGPNWLVTVSYMGNESVHAWINYQQNPAVYIPGKCGSSDCSTTGNTNSRRIFNNLNPKYTNSFAAMNTINDGATSSYNGAIFSVNRRMTKNFSLLANYTWAHCINEQGVFTEITDTTQDPNNIRGDRGNCASDLRKIYNVSLVAGVPHMKGSFARFLISDWRFSGILSGRSGWWISPTSGSDVSLTGVGADRPNVSGNSNNLSGRSITKWFDTSMYTKNTPGNYGNARRDSIVVPGRWQPDLSMVRNFPYTLFDKPQAVELRAEAFNAVNHPQMGSPSTTLSSAQFGKITSTSADPRIMQFSMKYVF